MPDKPEQERPESMSPIEGLDLDNPLSRRNFAKSAVGMVALGYAAAIGYPVYRYLGTPAEKARKDAQVTQTSLPDAQTLPKGSAMAFKFGGKPCMLIHLEDDTWVSYSAVCTHLGCTAQFKPDRGVIYCSCHGGTYDPATGKNIAGPPPKPLTKFNVEVTDAGVTITRA